MLITGRGGEGVVLASQILADTFARSGFFVQSFPEFKAERRGAQISAFMRWDTEPIRRRYKVRECDVLVSISASPPPASVVATLRPGGQLLVNRETRFPHHGDWHVSHVPGSRIARRKGILSVEGRPMGNVAVLGAAVKLLLPDGLESLEQAIRNRMGGRIAEPNVLAARAGYAECRRQHTVASDTLYEPEPAAPRPPLGRFAVSVTSTLSNNTGSWSLDRPRFLEACNVCGLCALFCPEGVMRRVDGAMVIDLDHCKGCGICEDVCPVKNAIEMEAIPA